MNYHYIKKDDMNNGDGLRTTLFLSGCSHFCKNCHNPETWNENSGINFTKETLYEIFKELDKDYIDGVTLSGGDPLYINNIEQVYNICKSIKEKYKDKTIWLYTGYTLEEILKDKDKLKILNLCDVLVDGEFVQELSDINYKWAGSTNQNIYKKQNNNWIKQ